MGTFISSGNVKLKNCSDFLCEHHQRRESSDDGFFFFHLAFAPERITLYHKHIAKKGRKLACVLLDCKEILSSWVFLELSTMSVRGVNSFFKLGGYWTSINAQYLNILVDGS